MNERFSPHQRLIASLATLGELTDGERAALTALPIRVQNVAAHRDLVTEGDTLSECCLILAGLFCRHQTIGKSQWQILSFDLPGDIPDLPALHLDQIDYSIWALTQSKVGFIPHTALRQAMEREQGLTNFFWRATLLDAAISRAWLASVGQRPAYERVAHLFGEIYTRMRIAGLADGAGFTLPVTQNELADALGLSAVHINRTLQQLRRDGVIVSCGHHHGFTDWNRLRKAGDFDPAYLFAAMRAGAKVEP